MAADYDDVSAHGGGRALYLAVRAAEDEVLAGLRDAQRGRELRQVRFGLLVNLVLHGRQIHGDVAAVSQAQRLDDVHHVQLGVECLRQQPGPVGHRVRLFREVHGEDDTTIVRHVAPKSRLRRRYTESAGLTRQPWGAAEVIWIVIALIMLVAFGPLLWLRPSPRERRLGRLRQRAYGHGMRVELRRLPGQDLAAEERVSAGGKPRDTSQECAAYIWPLARRLRMLPGLRMLRGDAGGSAGAAGWSFEAGKRPADARLDTLLEALRPLVERLPEDVAALEIEQLTVAGYWLEGADAAPERVDDLAARLSEMADLLTGLDARLEADTEPGNI